MRLAYTQQPGYIRRFMVHRTPFIHIEQMEKQTHFWRVLALDYSASMIHVPNRILLAYPKPTWAPFMVSSWNLPSPPTPNVVHTFQKKKTPLLSSLQNKQQKISIHPKTFFEHKTQTQTKIKAKKHLKKHLKTTYYVWKVPKKQLSKKQKKETSSTYINH